MHTSEEDKEIITESSVRQHTIHTPLLFQLFFFSSCTSEESFGDYVLVAYRYK
jgi:hypothetical protein